jgi:hypothetical protein
MPQITITAFNTNHGYTEHGQRIAYCVLSTGNVGMVDIDRGIVYVLTAPHTYDLSDAGGGCVRVPNINERSVLEAYQYNREAAYNEAEGVEFRKLIPVLEAAAAALAPSNKR